MSVRAAAEVHRHLGCVGCRRGGAQQGIIDLDPLAGKVNGRSWPTGTRQMYTKGRCLAPMDTTKVPVRVPVGVSRPGTARASASQCLMPEHNPSTTDGGQLSSSGGQLAGPAVLPAPRGHPNTVLINKYQ